MLKPLKARDVIEAATDMNVLVRVFIPRTDKIYEQSQLCIALARLNAGEYGGWMHVDYPPAIEAMFIFKTMEDANSFVSQTKLRLPSDVRFEVKPAKR